jgi:hypothetical protein
MARRAIAPAFILTLIGVFFLWINLSSLSMTIITEMWPGIVVLVGLTFWIGFIFGHDHDTGLAFVGTFLVLIGAFFFLFTLPNVTLPDYGVIHWSDLGKLWPVYLLIVGVALVVLWIVRRPRDNGLLVPAGILLVFGAGLYFTLVKPLRHTDMNNLWPVLLIVSGAAVLLTAVLLSSFFRPRA